MITSGIVGVVATASFSLVIASALDPTPAGNGGFTTLALPWESGLNTPAGMGSPSVGSTTAHKLFAAGAGGRFFPGKTRRPGVAGKKTFPFGGGAGFPEQTATPGAQGALRG